MSVSVLDYFLFVIIAVSFPMVVVFSSAVVIRLIDERRTTSYARADYQDNKRELPWYLKKEVHPKLLREKWYHSASGCFSACILSLSLLASTAVLSPGHTKIESLAYIVFQSRAGSVETAVLVISIVLVLMLLFYSIKPYACTNQALPPMKKMWAQVISLWSIILPIYYYSMFKMVWE